MSGTLRAKILRIRERERYMLREVKTLRGRCRYARTKASLDEHVTPHRRQVVLMLCVFEQGDSKRAAMFLAKSMRSTGSGAFGLAVIRETVWIDSVWLRRMQSFFPSRKAIHMQLGGLEKMQYGSWQILACASGWQR